MIDKNALILTNPRASILLVLFVIVLWVFRKSIGLKMVLGITILILVVILKGIDYLFDMFLGVLCGALIFSQIRDYLERKVESE